MKTDPALAKALKEKEDADAEAAAATLKEEEADKQARMMATMYGDDVFMENGRPVDDEADDEEEEEDGGKKGSDVQ